MPATFLSGYLINSILTSALLAVLVAALGRVVYGVPLPSAHVLAAVLTVLVGAFACCALAFAITIPIRKATTATALVPAITLTLFFLSGSFFSLDSAPAGLRAVADVFPIRHFYRRCSPRSTRTSPAAGSPSSTSASWPCGGPPAGPRGLEIQVDPGGRRVRQAGQPPALFAGGLAHPGIWGVSKDCAARGQIVDLAGFACLGPARTIAPSSSASKRTARIGSGLAGGLTAAQPGHGDGKIWTDLAGLAMRDTGWCPEGDLSSCAAPAGSPCRTSRGRVAAQYHTARFRLVPHLAKALSVLVPPLRKPGSAWTELPRPPPGRAQVRQAGRAEFGHPAGARRSEGARHPVQRGRRGTGRWA